MRKLIVFNSVSLDGYFVDAKGDMSWAHKQDPEWNAFVQGNASGGGELVFGRITYEMMANFWPSPQANQMMPVVADGMNKAPKIVFSKTMEKAAWNNTRLFKGDLPSEMRRLKQEPGPGLCILGSGTIVAPLAQHGLIDEFQFVICPVVLGAGRTLFATVKDRVPLEHASTRTFSNGNVLLCYQPLR